MKRATVVIGAAFGDEGKGLMTDYFASQVGSDALVVRFNGGAQAGHTVVTPTGRRHVFHHFGAGTLAGADTYLTHEFVCNPILFNQELVEIRDLDPLVYVSSASRVTVPYDMVINQVVEEHRGAARHGSCGVGINETIERFNAGHGICVRDLADPNMLAIRLRRIRDEWVPRRLGVLKVPYTDAVRARFSGAYLIDGFFDEVDRFLERVEVRDSIADVLDREHLIFEGAQGLLLDQRHRFFPHVTRSNTGLDNVLPLARLAGIKELDIHYVTRAYMTRHGAGPFPSEDLALRYEDATNLPHPFQGSLRFGRADLALIANAVRNDYESAEKRFSRVVPSLVVTHLDQVGEHVEWDAFGARRSGRRDDLVIELARACRIEATHLTLGPTRDDVYAVEEAFA